MNRRKVVILAILLVTSTVFSGLWLYAQQLEDEHESLLADQLEVVKAARDIEAGTPLSKDQITTEKVPRKFLPPNPLLESELNIYLGAPMAKGAEEGAMLLTTDFTFALDSGDTAVSGPNEYGEAGRLVVKNAKLTLRSDDPVGGMAKLTSIAASHGGFVVASSVRPTAVEEGIAGATLKARVPAEVFDAALNRLRQQGELVAEEVTGADVTDKFVDLEAELRNQKIMEAKMIELLSETKSVKDALDVEERLNKVRTETDKMEGRVKALKQRTALSTIEVTLTEEPQTMETPEDPGAFEPIERSLSKSGKKMVKVTAELIELVAAMVPLLLFFGPIGYAGFALWRRRRRREV